MTSNSEWMLKHSEEIGTLHNLNLKSCIILLEMSSYYITDNNDTSKQNNDVILVQIAGLVARRIVCESVKDQELKQGDRLGMIRFGSRADIYYENYEQQVSFFHKVSYW